MYVNDEQQAHERIKSIYGSFSNIRQKIKNDVDDLANGRSMGKDRGAILEEVIDKYVSAIWDGKINKGSIKGFIQYNFHSNLNH